MTNTGDREDRRMSDLISRQQAIDALADMHCKSDEDGYVWIIRSDAWARIDALPSAQPEQLEQCPIYGGMCAYPSDQCYDCPRHAGARMEVTT